MATSVTPARSIASLIALDWGTTSCRAYLLGSDGEVLAQRASPSGIAQSRGRDFAATFDSMTGDWRASLPELSAIAAGMVGSAHGWMEVPYCTSPAGVAELAARLSKVPGTALSIVPGVVQHGDAPDVMRGEETQIVGLLARHSEFSSRSRVVLPGTHSKWAHVVDGGVGRFTTFVTGELFATLRSHSVLGRFAQETERELTPAAAEVEFLRGVAAARDSSGGIAPLLFSVRSLVLVGALAPEASVEYLSGLLIGDELRCGLAMGEPPAAVVGEGALCTRYVAALALFGIADVLVVNDSARAGLWEIATRASLTLDTVGAVTDIAESS